MQTRPPVVLLVGAGLSTASGIPDYRSTGGIWETYDQDEFHVSRLHADPVRFWDLRAQLTRDMGLLDAEPNEGHRSIAAAVKDGRVDKVVTQNIDGLHHKAGTPAEAVIEVHGNGAACRCIRCGKTRPTRDVVRAHVPGEPPRCACGGLLKPDVVLFGEPVHKMPLAVAAVESANTLVTIGTSLQVWPVAGLCQHALDQGADLMIINRDPTPFDASATEVVRDDVVEALRRLFPSG